LNYTRGVPDPGCACWKPSASPTAHHSVRASCFTLPRPSLDSSAPGSTIAPTTVSVGGGGRIRIYSLIPLTAREPLRNASREFSLINSVMSRVSAGPHAGESTCPRDLSSRRRRRASPGASDSARRGGPPANRAPVARHSATPPAAEAT